MIQAVRRSARRAQLSAYRGSGRLRERWIVVAGVLVVRNESDLVGPVIRYHLDAGLDFVLVADDGSTDGTCELLAELERDTGRVAWSTTDDPTVRQGPVVTELAREAAALGADWVVPFDADEIWHAPSGLKPFLARTGAQAVRCRAVTFVQERGVDERSRSALRQAAWRPAAEMGDETAAMGLVADGRASYVEIAYPPKWISRASPELVIQTGNHTVSAADRGWSTGGELRCLHLPLRSRETLLAKAETGRALDLGEQDPMLSWHLRRWGRMSTAELETEWAANSHAAGTLRRRDGSELRLEHDPLFADLLAPYLDG